MYLYIHKNIYIYIFIYTLYVYIYTHTTHVSFTTLLTAPKVEFPPLNVSNGSSLIHIHNTSFLMVKTSLMVDSCQFPLSNG